MNVKRLASGKYQVEATCLPCKKTESIVLTNDPWIPLAFESEYQPTEQEITAEALLWDWIDGRTN